MDRCRLSFALPVPASAADPGLYVTPKLIYGYTVMDKLQGNMDVIDNYSLNHKQEKTDGTLGGALAVGYNFDKRFQIPLRAELEYSLFSRSEGTVSWDNIDEIGNDQDTTKTGYPDPFPERLLWLQNRHTRYPVSRCGYRHGLY